MIGLLNEDLHYETLDVLFSRLHSHMPQLSNRVGQLDFWKLLYTSDQPMRWMQRPARPGCLY